jgi:hypothetical protein
LDEGRVNDRENKKKIFSITPPIVLDNFEDEDEDRNDIKTILKTLEEVYEQRTRIYPKICAMFTVIILSTFSYDILLLIIINKTFENPYFPVQFWHVITSVDVCVTTLVITISIISISFRCTSIFASSGICISIFLSTPLSMIRFIAFSFETRISSSFNNIIQLQIFIAIFIKIMIEIIHGIFTYVIMDIGELKKLLKIPVENLHRHHMFEILKYATRTRCDRNVISRLRDRHGINFNIIC